MGIKIEVIYGDKCEFVHPYIEKLLVELGDEADELGALDVEKVKKIWIETPGAVALVAYADSGEVAGILTLVEAFAVYANGNYGVINEMYVEPEFRAEGVGSKLIEAAVEWGKKQGWKRIDVTGPESERWIRATKFYENLGFVFTGPKLKLFLE